MSTCKLCPSDLEGCDHYCTSFHFFIQQRPYVSRQGAPMDRTFEPRRITFRKGGKCGIPVKDGILKSFQGLEDRDSRPFSGIDIADQPALRIEWPGYPSWGATFRTRDHTPAKTPVSLSRLANDLCKSIARFIDEMEMKECDEPIPMWKVGPGCLDVDHLVLVSLQRVSHGTWKTSIRLADVEMLRRKNVTE